jgi:hypothetical protein
MVQSRHLHSVKAHYIQSQIDILTKELEVLETSDLSLSGDGSALQVNCTVRHFAR